MTGISVLPRSNRTPGKPSQGMVAPPCMLIEFLIPAYMRKDGAATAARSIIKQANGLPVGSIGVWIQDDCSLNISDSYYQELLSELQSPSSVVVTITRNASNMGMSKNILDMAEKTRAQYWAVLTDDDYLEEGSLVPLLNVVGAASVIECPLLFTPRYSYLESGELHCVECAPFPEYPSVIPSGALSALRYCRNGFILTGMIISSNCDFSAWKIFSDNAFFPVINFGAALISSPCLVVDRPWFHHTVLNSVYWQSWGAVGLLKI